MKKLNNFIQIDDVKISIGDIFCDSWGYEQTNVDFYQVVSLHGKKSVSLRKIAQRVVKPTSWCSADVSPVKDAFLNDEIIKRRVNVRGSENYSISVKTSDHSWAYRTSPERSHHSSWGY
ncbi:hypothetical protein [Morganella morganii]|uniref:hypothetical protein n=1 Tax=Morganella morganii TaxID=582 RepID=UPI00311938D4